MPASGPLSSTVSILDPAGTRIGLGTRIGAGALLTHNHLAHPPETYILRDAAGNLRRLAEGASEPVGPGVVVDGRDLGPQSRLISFPGSLGGTPAEIAPENVMAAVQLGDLLEVVHFDPEQGRVAAGSFSVSDIANLPGGAISVADPGGAIKKGDSGGGVFRDGRLVGNLWSVSPGAAHIALVPGGWMPPE